MKEGNDKGILVIRLSAMGDVAMTVPVLLALARSYPDLQLSFLTKKPFAPILQEIPNLTVLPFEGNGLHKGVAGLWRLSRELKPQRFTCVADLHAVLRTHLLKIFMSGTGIPFVSLDKGRNEKRRLTAWKEKTIHPLRHTIQRYADVLSQLGFPVTISASDVLPRKPMPASIDPKRNTKYKVGIAPFAAHEGKCYPEQAMQKVLSLLGNQSGIQIYLFGGGAKEVVVLDAWEKAYPQCISAGGRMSLTDELALISNLDLMVSMDSGNGHLAAMYGVPVITIWGATHPYAGFAPFNQPESQWLMVDREAFPMIPTSVYGNKVPNGYEKVMETIPPAQIYECILQVLGQGRPKQSG